MNVSYYGDGRIAFEDTIRDYAAENGLAFGDAIRFLMKRDSVRTALELLGIKAITRPIVNQYAAFLESKGYTPPKMYRKQSEQVAVSQKTNKPKKSETAVMDMDLNITKENYLDLRLTGMSRTAAQKHFELKPPTFYAFLRQWGIKDRVVEDQVLDAMREGHAVAQGLKAEIAVSSTKGPNTQSQQNPQASVDNSEQCEMRRNVTLSLTLTEHVMKESLQSLIEEAYDTARSKGWHEGPPVLPVQLALIHSEVSEALEADRKEHGADKVAEELADILIRTFDTAASHNIDLAGALFRKMHANRQREHRHGGLKY